MNDSHPAGGASAGDRPFIAIWEVTRACDLACVHCRASAQALRSPLELDTAAGEKLIDEIRALQVPVFVLTGGDPLKRPDIFHLIEYCVAGGVRVSLSPSATPLLTRDVVARLAASGLARIALSIDGASAGIHDQFRGVSGSYARTLAAVRWIHEAGLPLQINSTMSRWNYDDWDALTALVEALDPVLWSVFFLVPTGRARRRDLLSPEEIETVFGRLYDFSRRVAFDVKTTEGMHYRRYVVQRRLRDRQAGLPVPATPPWLGAGARERAPRAINDGKGFVFISHTGEVFPSGFLPVPAGNIRQRPLGEIYRDSPVFRALRDAANLKGKCGDCEFRQICGGSRARAFALEGDMFAADPSCAYIPQRATVLA